MNKAFEGIETTEKQVCIAGKTWRLLCLKDRQQFHDPSGKHEAAGVVPASWPFFGVLWDAGIRLAELMATEPMAGKSVLELGCGLGLPSLVLASRGVQVLATDLHPLAGDFLLINATTNGIKPVDFMPLDFRKRQLGDGAFEFVIGSDLLYEPDQPQQLASFCADHCTGELIITDPGRKQLGRFSRLMEAEGFEVNLVEAGRFARFRRVNSLSE